jgi:serine/threonine protein kinase
VHLARKAGREGGLRCLKRFTKAVSGGRKTSVARSVREARSVAQSIKASVEKEYDIMQKVGGHPRILEAFSLFQDAAFFYIEMPYCAGGDFCDLKARAAVANICLKEAWWKRLFKSCIEALAHLHSHEVVHCDVKEANLLIKTADYSEPAIVLADFGIARMSSESATTTTDDIGSKQHMVIYGTPGYIPPEVWESKIWRPEGDMFSLGVVVAQMLTSIPLFTAGTNNLKEIRHATMTKEPPLVLIHSTSLRKLAEAQLEKNPANRPRAKQILCDNWLDDSPELGSDGSLQQEDVVPEKKATFEEGSNSISTATGLDSQSFASSCSDHE